VPPRVGVTTCKWVAGARAASSVTRSTAAHALVGAQSQVGAYALHTHKGVRGCWMVGACCLFGRPAIHDCIKPTCLRPSPQRAPAPAP
jgi:hypothetical protein